MIQQARPAQRSSTSVRRATSPLARPCSRARAGLMARTLSQVTVFSGLGSSCSQGLLAKLPSQTLGSGRKISSKSLRRRHRRPALFGQTGRRQSPPQPAQPSTKPYRSALSPLRFVEVPAPGPPPGLSHHLAALDPLSALQVFQDHMARAHPIEGPDQRLDQAGRTIDRPRVAPGFQVVLQRDVPMAASRRLVPVQTGVDA